MGTETTNLSSTQDQTRRVSEQPYLPNSSTMIKIRHALALTTLTKGFCLSATALLALVGTLVVALLTAQHAQAHDVAAFLEPHAASPFVIGSHHHHRSWLPRCGQAHPGPGSRQSLRSSAQARQGAAECQDGKEVDFCC